VPSVCFSRSQHDAYRKELKQHTVPCGLHEATAVSSHESVSHLAVFAERAGGAHLIEARR